MDKVEVRELLKDIENIKHFTVFNTLFVIHFKNGSVLEIESGNGTNYLDYYYE